MTYLKTSELPGYIASESGQRWSIKSIHLFVNRPAAEHPLVPDQKGRRGQSHLFRPETVRRWLEEERCREIAERCRIKIARLRRMGRKLSGEE